MSLLMFAAGCGVAARLSVQEGMGPKPTLPPPRESWIPVVNIARAIGWPAGSTPRAAESMRVTAFAEGLDHPRWLYVLPNGDVLVAETNAQPRAQPSDSGGLKKWLMKKLRRRAGAAAPSADRITLLRDEDGDGVAEMRGVFLENLRSPFGMTLVGEDFYVANTDALVRFRYRDGQTRIDSPGETVVELPAGPLNHHWTKNVIADQEGRYLYVTVGSNSNVAENGLEQEQHRAAVLQVDPAAAQYRIFASGLRNPNGLAWEPHTGLLWTTVNERDGLGSDLVPDYMTALREGEFYGWPYSYFGSHVDERVQPQRPERVAAARVPDYALGPHTASLGLAWSGANALERGFQHGMFVGQHGSWNRKPHSGYQVIFVPFAQGRPNGAPREVLGGFLSDDGEAYGRPVGVIFDKRGALLVADDVGNVIWRVSAR